MPADPTTLPPDIPAIAARHAAASPGPWSTRLEGCHAGDWTDVIDADGRRVALLTVRATEEEHDANADFIAASWEDVRALLAEVGRLKAERSKLLAWATTAVSDRNVLLGMGEWSEADVLCCADIGEPDVRPSAERYADDDPAAIEGDLP